MTDSFDRWRDATHSAWGPLTSQLVARARRELEHLVRADPAEGWLAALHQDAPASLELYRDPMHGFVLQAHREEEGIYRPPHDHGRSWVIYAVQRGEVEMGTYASMKGPDGQARLVKRESTRLRPGRVQVYLPGDIHDTLCLKGPALLIRLTERDLRREKEEGRMLRYVEADGGWAPAAA